MSTRTDGEELLPSTALAQVVVDELYRCGVREAVLAPGSRSAALALALYEADQGGRIRLHVRIDERSAGFLAIGLAKAGRRPVPVVCTSGTAAANLHPAVLEAHHIGVPLVVMTADRPPELRGVGANQTVDQIKLYGEAVRMFHEVGVPERRPGQNAYWRELIDRSLAVARGFRDRNPGPVHLNFAFREPLVPTPRPQQQLPDGDSTLPADATQVLQASQVLAAIENGALPDPAPGPGQPGQPGAPGYPSQFGQPGHAGQPGQAGQPGYFGSPGPQGQPGQAGQPGQPASPMPPGAGQPGQPGAPGYPGRLGQPGPMNQPGEIGQSGPMTPGPGQAATGNPPASQSAQSQQGGPSGSAVTEAWPESLHGREGGGRWTRIERLATDRISWLEPGPRTVVVAGDGADAQARWLAETAGWPLLAEPSSGARSGPNAIGAYTLLLESEPGLAKDIQRVVVFGRPTLSREVSRLLAREDVEVIVVSRRPPWPDAARRASRVAATVALEGTVEGAGRRDPDDWLSGWLAVDQQIRHTVDEFLTAEPEMTGLHVAREVAAAVPGGGLLVAGSSQPIRHLDVVGTPWDNRLVDDAGRIDATAHRKVIANRGVSGIDGTMSVAIGAALMHRSGPAYALLGDLAFLHDSNALVRGPYEARPDLTAVVLNDDGGGIFSTLEQGAEAHAEAFERVFGTPHGVDFAALAAATHTPYSPANDISELRAALSRARGLKIVEVRVDRSRTRDVHERLKAAVHKAVASG